MAYHGKCKNDAQKYAIKKSYAVNNRQSNRQFSKESKVKKASSFKLPLKEGGHCWNIYKVPNTILNGMQNNDVHRGLVLDENNNNVLLVQVTHSSRLSSRNNLPIRNLNSKDLDKNGQLRQSYLQRRLIATHKEPNGAIVGISNRCLLDKTNDLEFTVDEKKQILNELSNLSTAQERYNLFLEHSNKKDNKN